MLKLVNSIKSLDFSKLVQVYAEYSDSTQETQDFYLYLLDFFAKYDGVYAIWLDDGRYCSALRIEPYRDGFLISGLETAASVRRKGYGKLLLQSVLECAYSYGWKRMYAHIADDNQPSVRLHQACGFCKVLDHAVYLDGSVYHSSSTYCYKVE